jgi:hypothetical protein
VRSFARRSESDPIRLIATKCRSIGAKLADMLCRAMCLLVVLSLCGCAVDAPPVASARPPTSQPADPVPAGKVRIQFEKFNCFCHVGGVEQSLLTLPGVTGVDWDVTAYRVTLDVKNPPPTDAQINDALLYSNVKIARIERP